MLVLSRRPGEKLLLPSVPASLSVVSFRGRHVRLGIEAPAHVPVLRGELYSPGPRPEGPGRVEPRHRLGNHLHNLTLALAVLRLQLGGGPGEDVRSTLDRLERGLHALCDEVSAPDLAPCAGP